MPPRVIFEEENGQDEDKALLEACRHLEKFHWDKNDLPFTLNQIERKMKAVGVKNQYTKFQALASVLPKDVQDEVKHLLRLGEEEFPNNDSYKQLKHEIKRIFGQKPEAAVERALGRVLTSKPSVLARGLVNDICKKQLDCECCPAVISTLWKRHLPSNVKDGIAHCEFTEDSFNATVDLADKIFDNNKPSHAVAAVTVAQASLDETQPAIPYAQPEVAAIRGRGRGRGGRGRGSAPQSGSASQANGGGAGGVDKPKHKGTRHPDLPPINGCAMHFKWGRGAYFCSEPATCTWRNIIATKPNK